MLALHQTTSLGKDEPAGLGGNPNLHYARELAERGYVVMVPDYPSFGDDSTYNFDQDYYVSGTMKGIGNHLRGADYLTSLPIVDARAFRCDWTFTRRSQCAVSGCFRSPAQGNRRFLWVDAVSRLLQWTNRGLDVAALHATFKKKFINLIPAGSRLLFTKWLRRDSHALFFRILHYVI
jgi:hypothetical protein